MSALPITLGYLLVAFVDILLIVAAFRTSTKLGIMALFVPIYVVTTGNHRLKTENRRQLAWAWWLSLAGLVVLVAASPR